MEADDHKWDAFVQNVISALVEPPHNQQRFAVELVQYTRLEDSQIDALVTCGKLKSAYLIAVKTGQKKKVAQIRDVAKAKGYETEYRLCEKYLALAESGQLQ